MVTACIVLLKCFLSYFWYGVNFCFPYQTLFVCVCVLV